MTWYFTLAAIVASMALILLLLTYLPKTVFATLQDKTLPNLITIFFSAVSGLSLKEIQSKRDKILLLQFVIEEYEELDRSGAVPGSPEQIAAESHCVLIVEKVLGS